MDTVPDFFARYGVYYGDRPAVVFGDLVRTYRETADRSNRLGNGLLGLGVTVGTPVALLSDNRPEVLEVFFARQLVGAVEVTLNTRLLPAEWARQIAETGCRVVVASAVHLARLRAVADDLLDGVDSFVVFDGGCPGAQDYEDLVAGSSPGPPPVDVPQGFDALGRIVYTGGTTGSPKGVLLSRGADLAQTRNVLLDLAPDLHTDSVFLGLQPMYHAVRPFFLPCWMRGATHVVVPDFRAETAFAAIESRRVTHLKTVPTLLNRLLDAPGIDERDLSSLRTVFYGGSPMPVQRLRAAIARWGAIFVQNYGQTESAMTVARLTKEDHLVGLGETGERGRLSSVGRPYSWVDVKLVDGAGRQLGCGEVGELLVRGDHNMMGYLDRPEETAQTLVDGWVRTRDMAVVDERGYLHLLDRRSEMIVTGGENVYPGEVEQVLYRHPAVLEAAVFGVPDDVWGEAVTAAVVPQPGARIEAADLIAFARQQLPTYKCPQRVVFHEELPKSGTGKILRRELRAPWWVGRSRSIQ